MKFLTVAQHEAFLDRVEKEAVDILGRVVIEAAVDPSSRDSQRFAREIRPRIEDLVEMLHWRQGNASAEPPGTEEPTKEPH